MYKTLFSVSVPVLVVVPTFPGEQEWFEKTDLNMNFTSPIANPRN
jgi:hypothetical protein